MRAVARVPPDPAALASLSEIPLYNAMLRTTCVATRLDGGHADNALPQTARATVNCRVHPEDSLDWVQKTLGDVVADPQVTITPIDQPQTGPPSTLDGDVFKAIERITREMWPEVPLVPIMSPGATDSIYFRAAGIPMYGVTGMFQDVDDVRMHGKDERLLVRSFDEGREFLYRLLKALSSSAPAR
jgi:acetylornithine deacetylase/succinyl-diaminopimelate desuccinylase-like protein